MEAGGLLSNILAHCPRSGELKPGDKSTAR